MENNTAELLALETIAEIYAMAALLESSVCKIQVAVDTMDTTAPASLRSALITEVEEIDRLRRRAIQAASSMTDAFHAHDTRGNA
jgi:hypothetical protein